MKTLRGAIELPPAGRELDALVAEQVMGLDVSPRSFDDHDWFLENTEWDTFLTCRNCGITNAMTEPWPACVQDAYIPAYSTNMAAAWQVVERMMAGPVIYQIQASEELGWHRCTFYVGIPEAGDDDPAWREWRVEAATAPLAICLAALRASEPR